MPSRESDTSRMLLLEEDTATVQALPRPGVKRGASAVPATASVLGKAGRRQRRFSKTNRLRNVLSKSHCYRLVLTAFFSSLKRYANLT